MAELGGKRCVEFAPVHQAEDDDPSDHEPHERCPDPGSNRAKIAAQDPPLGHAEGRPEDQTEHGAEEEPGEVVDDVPGHHAYRDERDQARQKGPGGLRESIWPGSPTRCPRVRRCQLDALRLSLSSLSAPVSVERRVSRCSTYVWQRSHVQAGTPRAKGPFRSET